MDDASISEKIREYEPDGITVASCHAVMAAMLGDVVFLTVYRKNNGPRLKKILDLW
jgi:hypothetical protein